MKKFIRVLVLVCMIACLFSLNAYAETYRVENQADFESVLAAAVSGDTITIAAGTEVTLPSGSGDKSLTIKGEGTTSVLNMKDKVVSGYNSLSFENLSYLCSNANYKGIQHIASASYNNVSFDGTFWNYAISASFNGCTFNQKDSGAYNVWTYGGSSVSFTGCTFDSAGRSMLIYNENHNGGTYNFSGCTFNASTAVEGKAAIEIDSSLLKDGKHFTVNIDSSNTANGFGTGSVSGNSLYNLKKGDETTCTINLTQPPVNPNPGGNDGGNGGGAQPQPKPEVSNPYSVPSTADNSNVALWSLLFVAFAAVAVLTAKKRKA